MGLNTTTKLVSDVVTDVRRTFGDEASIQITDADIIRWVNSAQREILIQNKILRAVGTTDVTAGQSEYNLASLNVVSIQSIHLSGRKLEYRSFNEAEEYVQRQDPLKKVSSDPTMWFEWGGTINLYPIPDTTVVAGLTVYYIKDPIMLALVTDALSVPDSYYETVLQFVMAKAYELDEDTQNATTKYGQFTARLNTLADAEAYPNQDTYPRISIREEDM